MKKFLLAAMLVCAPFAAFGQTPHEDCDHMANNSSATVTGNSSNDCLDEVINGQGSHAFPSDANDSMTADELRGIVATVPAGSAIFDVTGTLTATRDLDMPDGIERVVRFRNSTTGDQSIRIIQNAGRTVTIPPGLTVTVSLDGTHVDPTGVDISTELVSSAAGDRFVAYDDSADAWVWVDHSNMPGGGASAIEVEDEGTSLTTGVTKFNFVGSTVTVTEPVTDEMLVTVGDPAGAATIHGPMKEIARQTASSDTTIDFFFDPTLYEDIEIRISDLVPGTDAQALNMRVSLDGTTFSSASLYGRLGEIRFDTTADQDVNGSLATEVALVTLGTGTDETSNIEIVIPNPDSADFKGGFMRIWGYDDEPENRYLGASWNIESASTIQGVQFIMASGNIASGEFILYGRPKAGITMVANNGDWEVIEEQTLSTTTADFFWTDGLYDQIQFELLAVDLSVDDRILQMRMSTDGSTFDSGASDYRHSNTGISSVEFNTASATAAEWNLATSQGTATEENLSGTITIYDPGAATYARGLSLLTAQDTLSDTQLTMSAGARESTTAVVGAQFLLSDTGNLSGRIIMRGRRKTPNILAKSGHEVVIETQDITSSVANVNFDFNEDLYTRLRLEIDGLEVVTDDASVRVRIKQLGSVQSTGGDYSYNVEDIDTAASAEARTNSDSADAIYVMSIVATEGVGNAAGESANATIFIHDPSGANQKSIKGDSSHVDGGGLRRGADFKGWFDADTDPIDGIEITTDNGNIDNGTFRLYGTLK